MSIIFKIQLRIQRPNKRVLSWRPKRNYVAIFEYRFTRLMGIKLNIASITLRISSNKIKYIS